MNTIISIESHVGTHSLKSVLKDILIGEWKESLLLVIFLIVGIIVSKKVKKHIKQI